jgi:hypothetical protein
VGSAQMIYKESRLELSVTSEIVSGPADRQSDKGDPRPWLGGRGQSSTVLSQWLESAVLEPEGREE